MQNYLDRLYQLEALQRELEQLITGREPGPRLPVAFLPGRAARAYPLVNISQDRENIYLEALSPGIKPETLDLSIIRNMLTISGEKPAPSGVAPERYHRSERSAGKFARTIELPVEVNSEKVSAVYTDGVLRIILPKHEAARPKQITVSVS